MRPSDIDAVIAIAAEVHPGYPEDAEVLTQKYAAFSEGCFAFDVGGDVRGYALSHPWYAGKMPKLNQFIEALPGECDSYYLHDIALLPSAQGRGAAKALAELLATLAWESGFTVIQLCAVNGSASFWQRQGFEKIDAPELASTLASYGADVHFMSRDLSGNA